MLAGNPASNRPGPRFGFTSVPAMPPTVKENGILTARPETAQLPAPNNTSPSDAAIKQQAVALEVPVTVNGARPVEGSDKRDPFSENPKTLPLSANATIIRLSSSFPPPHSLFPPTS